MTERARNHESFNPPINPLLQHAAGPERPAPRSASRPPKAVSRGFRSWPDAALFPWDSSPACRLAMLTVGTLTLVTSVSGSYAVGGTAAGAVGIGSAIGAPVLGALADRRGQRPVLLVAAALNALAVLALIAAAYAMPAAGAFPAALLAAAFVSGASCPQVGPLARVRWMALTSGRNRPPTASCEHQDLDTALSYESTADELTFVLGPALVGILASLVAPWLPLALAAALTITLVPAFAVHRTHRAVPSPPPGSSTRHVPPDQLPSAVPSGPARPAATRNLRRRGAPVLAMVCMGTFFGSTQTALSSFSAGFATSEIAGLLYAVMGLSSAAAAIVRGLLAATLHAGSARWLLGAAPMAALASCSVPSSAGAWCWCSWSWASRWARSW